jgi:hypothetical protein
MGGSTPKDKVTTQATSGSQETSGTQTGTQFGATAGTQSTAVDIPDYLRDLIAGVPGVSATALQNLEAGTQGFQVPPEALEALRSTAAGDFLYGGPQMEAFTSAAQRAAMPGIYSTFGGSGRGGGGLEKVAIGQAGIDAFANMFNQERGRQLQAAELLPRIQSLPLALQQQLLESASLMPGRFAPLFGQTGTQAGSTFGETFAETLEKMKSESKSTTTEPIFETPMWQNILGGAAALGGMFMPGLGGVSAMGNLGTALLGSKSMEGLSGGGLLGLFK